MTSTSLPLLAIIEISGADAPSFLQNQCTSDVNDCSFEASLFTSICNTKGRMVASFLLYRITEESFGIILNTQAVPAMLAHLNKYLVFSKATASINNEAHVSLVEGASNHAFTTSKSTQNTLIKHPYKNYYWCVTSDNNHPENVDQHNINILGGVYFSDENDVEKLLPQVINLGELGGISYTKGCYIGQEIIARMKYLGKQKKHMVRYQFNGHAPHLGTDITFNNKKVGYVLDVASCDQLLAIVDKELPDSVIAGSLTLTKATSS